MRFYTKNPSKGHARACNLIFHFGMAENMTVFLFFTILNDDLVKDPSHNSMHTAVVDGS